MTLLRYVIKHVADPPRYWNRTKKKYGRLEDATEYIGHYPDDKAVPKFGQVTERTRHTPEAFDYRLDKETALFLIEHELLNGAVIMCKEYGEDEDWVGMESKEDIETLQDPEYKTFEIWLENEDTL